MNPGKVNVLPGFTYSKVIDAAVLSKFYKGCQIWQKKEGMNSSYAHKNAR